MYIYDKYGDFSFIQQYGFANNKIYKDAVSIHMELKIR